MRAAAALRVVVVEDEAIGEVVRRLRGEWSARSGGELEIAPATLRDLVDGKLPEFDVIIFPSRHLGTLVERGELQPVRDSVLASPELALADIYPAIRQGEMTYGGQMWALPLGSPPLLAATPTISMEAHLPAMPMAGKTAAWSFLARALAYVESPRRGTALFDAETMAPQIEAAPFERALRNLVADAAAREAEAPIDFRQGIELVQSGRASWSLGWPGLTRGISPDDEGFATGLVTFGALPTSAEVFVTSSGDWQNQGDAEPVTILGVEGRLIGVGRGTRNAVSAMKLCQWLATGSAAVRVSSRSAGTAWFRQSQVAQSREWLNNGAGPSSADTVNVALAVETPWVVPRVPGVDEYLDALAEQVRRACAGEVEPAAALRDAAEAWESITEGRGREAQAAAYRRHLGIDGTESQR